MQDVHEIDEDAHVTSKPKLEEVRRFLKGERPLPGQVFRDEDVFRDETKRIFSREWVSITCAQNVAKPGDVFPVYIAGYALLVVRDKKNQVRVFYNMCTHRGASLVTEPCHARGGLLSCPYHGWVFSLDGSLSGAPFLSQSKENPRASEEELRGRGLVPVRSVVWRDIVFVDLSGSAEPFEERIAPLDEHLEPWTAEELHPLSTNEYTAKVNWKLAAENFVDAYHLPVVHSQICPTFQGALEQCSLVLSDRIAGMLMPGGYGSDKASGADSPLPVFSGLEEEQKSRVEAFFIFPNTLILVESDYQQVIVLRPQGAALLHETFASYLVSEEAFAKEHQELRDETDRASLKINDQDIALLEELQKSRSMPAADHTKLATEWDQTVAAFQSTWAHAFLGAHALAAERD
ncbi:MAG: aromatic ring-hydroxylating dioxygenase subunit alpha [Myxococcota bacterium]|nr:aromatic ring-hydroxylating dioxygenase subunit alpha [Myxococcota bacterium]